MSTTITERVERIVPMCDFEWQLKITATAIEVPLGIGADRGRLGCEYTIDRESVRLELLDQGGTVIANPHRTFVPSDWLHEQLTIIEMDLESRQVEEA